MPTKKTPSMRASTWKERALDALRGAGASLGQQPVVRAAGMVGDAIGEGMTGNMGREDSPWAGPAEGQLTGTMPGGPGLRSVNSIRNTTRKYPGQVPDPQSAHLPGRPTGLNVVNATDKFGHADIAEGIFEALTSKGRRITTPEGIRREVLKMGYDDYTRAIAREAADDPNFINQLRVMLSVEKS